MASKNKAKGGKPKSTKEDDDDWEVILAAEALANGAAAAAAQLKLEASKAAEAAAAAAAGDEADGSDDDDEDDAADAGAKKDKDKKKKKKKTKKDEKKTVPVAAPVTAAGKAILLRQQQFAEEELRIKALQDAEDRKFREEEEKEEAERKAVEDEKERKRKAKQDKLESQKAAGTYMTKAEKEKAKKLQERLESMKAAGMLPGAVTGLQDGASVAIEAGKTSSLYSNKKKPPANNQKQAIVDTKPAGPEEVPVAVAPVVQAKIVDAVADNWDDDDGEDDWESSTNIERISTIVEAKAAQLADDVEDTLVLENRMKFEELKLLGIERAKRDEETRLRREIEERAREEMEQREREAAIRKESSRKRRTERDDIARAARTPNNLRSPISCIMGHVDTGKTKLLDKIRHTNVQEGEAGGITQQIGATQFSKETLAIQTQSMQASHPFEILLPGLLVIDTPGHESFTNLRNRGSSLCDIAILVIDLMHGLEQQTIESINMLKRKRAPFVVALNKVDRCYGWKTLPDGPIREALALQDENCRLEFKDRTDRVIVQLMEQGLNSKLYWENEDLNHTVSLVPTSAVTGEGVPDLLMMLITLTQERQQEKLMYMDVLQCTVLEVKVVEGLGHTIDVVLVNGTLREGDTIVVSTMEGPVVTSIRALLTPPPNREMRVKSEYIHHQELKGAIGIKIVATDIGRAIAGTPLLVVREGDDVEDVKDDVQSDLSKVMKALATDSKGVMVHASTLGALEALLQFLREECKPPIPVSHINIGPIFKKDVMRANIMNEKGQPEFATILAFDVKVDSEAATFAEESKVRIFTADIIYHLFDQFSAYMNGLNEARKAEATAIANFPCILKILPQHIFNKKDPIVLGVEILDGSLRLGTLLTVPSLGLDIGKVTSIENNHKEVPSAKKGTSVSIKIACDNSTMTYGRQFDDKNALYSKISRQSIDALKQYFKDDMSKEDWGLVVKLKKVFGIP